MGQPINEPRNKLYCNRCDGDTNHEIVWMGKRIEDLYAIGDSAADGPAIQEEHQFRLWRCVGCDSVCLEHAYGLDIDNHWTHDYHPKPERHSVKTKHFNKLPKRLSAIYQEAIMCYNSTARILCAVGLRGLVEGICRDKGIAGRTIADQIEGLKEILPESIVNNLHSLRFMGNQATHELEPPSGYDLSVALEICEDLLNYLYELDYKTARLAHWNKPKKAKP